MKHAEMAHTVANVQSNADKITNFAMDKVQHLIDVAAATLPKATHYALETVGIQCLIDSLRWAISVPIFIGFLVVCLVLVRKGNNYEPEDRWDDGKWFRYVPAMLFAVALIVTLVIALTNIPYWSFIGINHPDLYVVHLALDKVLN